MKRRRKSSSRRSGRGGAGDSTARGFLQDHLNYLLGQAGFAVYKDFEPEVRAAGLASLEWRVLATLVDGGPHSVGELARQVLAKQPTLTKRLLRMQRSGLVRLGSDAQDARRTVASATAHGRALALPLIRKARAHEAALLGGFPARDLRALKAILRALIAAPRRDRG